MSPPLSPPGAAKVISTPVLRFKPSSKGCVPLAVVLIFCLFLGSLWWEVYSLLAAMQRDLEIFHICNQQPFRHSSPWGSQAVSCVCVPGYEPITMSKDLPHISWIYPQHMLEELKKILKKIPYPPFFEERVENVQPSLGRKYRIFQHLLALCI